MSVLRAWLARRTAIRGAALAVVVSLPGGLTAGGCLLPAVELDADAPGNAPAAGGTSNDGMPEPQPTVTVVEPSTPAAAVPPSCEDNLQNQNESDRDCGGRCNPCARGLACASLRDCELGLLCSEQALVCVAPECTDKVVNGNEVGIDCGGGCPGCPTGTPCNEGSDCASLNCNGSCAAPACDDAVRNQDESDTDCGGSCPRCATGAACATGADCLSAACGATNCAAGVPLCCQARPVASSACSNGNLDGTEADIDCGGADPTCARCVDGNACILDGDCQNGDCSQGVCISCVDGARNGTETDVDCGGTCALCGAGSRCVTSEDCATSACVADALRIPRCCGGSALDCTRCAEVLSPGVDCTLALDTLGAANCATFLQCLANNPQSCPTRNAPNCSGVGGVCDQGNFGGALGTGITTANLVLTSAGCLL